MAHVKMGLKKIVVLSWSVTEVVGSPECGSIISLVKKKTKNKRNNKMEFNQRQILMHPEKYGNNYNDINTQRKDKLINRSVNNGYGNSLPDMSGCPIQQVHKMKQKKRDKLKKYLYQGKEKNGYEYNKYKLQKGNGVSIEMTPDYRFRRVLDPKKQNYKEEILDQIQKNNLRKTYEDALVKDQDRRDQECYSHKIVKYEKKQERNKQALKKKFMKDIDLQIRQKYMYSQRAI